MVIRRDDAPMSCVSYLMAFNTFLFLDVRGVEKLSVGIQHGDVRFLQERIYVQKERIHIQSTLVLVVCCYVRV